MNVPAMAKSVWAAGQAILHQVTGDPDQKRQLEAEFKTALVGLEREFEATYRQRMETARAIIIAEINSGDKWTRRMRPAFVMWCMGLFTMAHIVAPLVMLFKGLPPQSLPVPTELSMALLGTVSAWFIGRTMEKRKQIDALPGRVDDRIETLLGGGN